MTTVGAAAPSASASASGGNDVKAPEQREEGNEVEEREAAELGGNSSSSLKSVLESSETLKPSHVEVVDVSGGCGQSFNAVVVSDAFDGKTALARHRLVNASVKEQIKDVHAWSVRCLTKRQWEEAQAGGGSG